MGLLLSSIRLFTSPSPGFLFARKPSLFFSFASFAWLWFLVDGLSSIPNTTWSQSFNHRSKLRFVHLTHIHNSFYIFVTTVRLNKKAKNPTKTSDLFIWHCWMIITFRHCKSFFRKLWMPVKISSHLPLHWEGRYMFLVHSDQPTTCEDLPHKLLQIPSCQHLWIMKHNSNLI